MHLYPEILHIDFMQHMPLGPWYWKSRHHSESASLLHDQFRTASRADHFPGTAVVDGWECVDYEPSGARILRWRCKV